MVYKIGLVSTHGTGKTVLAQLVAGELKRRGVEAIALPEISTLARERGLPINEETTLEAQLWILHRQFAEELVYAQPRPTPPNYEVIVCDRGPDNFCYLRNKYADEGHDSSKKYSPIEYARQMVLGHLQHFPYSRLFLLPIVENSIEAGSGVRPLDLQFQRKMEREVGKFLRQEKIAHEELPKPSPDDHYRNEWVKIIVNQTLQDLQRPEKLQMT